jgi:protein-tyrosine phosphatase
MAELICRKLLAQQLKCRLDQLEDRGMIVMSAGMAAMAGGGATPEAVQVLADRGLDLSTHITQPLNERLVRHADLIFTMTQAHRQAVVAHWPDAAERTYLLCGDHVDVADPIGGPRELYRSCADQIEAAIRRRIAEFGIAG